MTEMLDGQISFFDQGLPFGRMSPEPSAVTKDRTSEPSYRHSAISAKTEGFQFLNLKEGNGNLMGASWETVGVLPGQYSTPVKWAKDRFHNEENESTLSQILDLNAPEKYYLSPKACAGILRRAEKRGKTLPDMLRDALMEVVGFDG